jgi:hypothetical protein
MQQPSAQGIASLFRGNPAPLQQRIQQEQQGKPGLPPDLQKLLALNIVTNEKDAVAKQQAMDQLAQMQGQQGKPPTVMESVQEQARQKMQAQALQAQQQQQGLQALAQQAGPGPVPEGTQFAEAQPQGIDELPVEFGLAGGGIVAFDNGGTVDAERAKEKEARSRLMSFGLARRKDDPEGFEQAKADAEAAAERRKAVEALYAQEMAAAGMDRPVQVTGMPKAPAQPPAQTPARALAENRGALNASDAAVRSAPGTQEKPIADLKGLADQKRRQQATRPAAPAEPTGQPMGAQTATGAPPPQSEVNRFLTEQFQRDPQAGAANQEMMYQSRVPAPDTTQRDAMIKQLQEERARQVGPQDSFGQLMEYLGQIAATPRGMSSFEAGAAGARGVRGLEEQRAQKRFDLGAKIIEQEQGKIDASRQYAKEVYGIGAKEYDQIFQAKLEAAKRISTDEMEARKMAQQETLKMLELKQQAELRREEMAKDIKVANIGAASRNSGATALTPNQRAEIANKAKDNVQNELKTNMRLLADTRKNPGLVDMMVQRETDRLMAAAEGRTIAPAPGAASPGGTNQQGWGIKPLQ